MFSFFVPAMRSFLKCHGGLLQDVLLWTDSNVRFHVPAVSHHPG